ncbi:MAG TPA: hypothetical protein VF145_03960 [Chitinophagaceae bacterium]
MVKFHDIKIGDYLMGEFEGKMWQGEVVRLNGEDKQVCLETDVQEFWFEPEHLYPIPLTDEALRNLSFTREDQEDGSLKYKKGSFRLVIPAKDDFSHIDMWYREDRRHNPDIHYVHQLQNAYLQMTKVHLTREAV